MVNTQTTTVVGHSALTIVPSIGEAEWDQIQAIRKEFDKQFDRWMPHINLLFPFCPPDQFPRIAKKLTRDMRKFTSPCRLRLNEIGMLEHGKSATVVLLVEQVGGNTPLVNVFKALEASTGVKSEHPAFTPHLTLGQAGSKYEAQKIIEKMRKMWRAPIEFDVEHVQLISRDKDTPFHIDFNVALGCTDANNWLEDDLAAAAALAPTIVSGFIPGLQKRLLSTVCAGLISEAKFGEDSRGTQIFRMVKTVAEYTPDFVLKTALYVRDDLGIRTTANMLVAMASFMPQCHPYLRAYVPKIIRLPSDWLEIVLLHRNINPDASLPTALRKALIDRFQEFDVYQLGKYNREKKNDDGEHVTLKYMIRVLHMSTPKMAVMQILGKKYPADSDAFAASGLEGSFDSALAGKRMKLPVPETWETQVSAHGNVARTWEQLLDNRKLPFMAMLRNLRNMVQAGISEKHHDVVISTLCNEGAVSNSRQFPFRFFSAFDAVDEAFKEEDSQTAAASQAAARAKGKTALKILKKQKEKKKTMKLNPAARNRLIRRYKNALDTAVKIATMANIDPIHGSTVVFCDVGPSMQKPCSSARGMGTVRQVVDVAVLLALMFRHACEDCEVILYSSDHMASAANVARLKTMPSGNLLECVKAILGTTVKNLLDGLSAPPSSGGSGYLPSDVMEEMVRDRRPVDNLVMLSSSAVFDPTTNTEVARILKLLRQEVNSEMLYINVDLAGRGGIANTDGSGATDDDKNVMMAGFSDNILRFVGERGNSAQLDYVNAIHETKAVDLSSVMRVLAAATTTGKKNKNDNNSSNNNNNPLAAIVSSLSPSQIFPTHTGVHSGNQWKLVRVFLSSTFLDMHGERDCFSRLVMPSVRERAAVHLVDVVEVDLRWGISSDVNSVRMCLEEVCRCHVFVGLLGHRYGARASVQAMLEAAEDSTGGQLQWLKEYCNDHNNHSSIPQSKSSHVGIKSFSSSSSSSSDSSTSSVSITELEIRQAMRDTNNSLLIRPLLYFRDPSALAGAPVSVLNSHLKDAAGSKNEQQLDHLKHELRSLNDKGSVHVRWDGYPGKYQGMVQGKAIVGNLDDLCAMAAADIWYAIAGTKGTQSKKPSASHGSSTKKDVDDQAAYHESLLQYENIQFVGRSPELHKIVAFASSADNSNGSNILIARGPSGFGKTALLAAAVDQLRVKGVLTLPHVVGSSAPGSNQTHLMLFRFSRALERVCCLAGLEATTILESANLFEQRAQFEKQLHRISTVVSKVVFVVDGIDDLVDSTTEIAASKPSILAWLPLSLPACVRVIVSSRQAASNVSVPSSATWLSLAPLSKEDRTSVVSTYLQKFSKSLDTSGRNDQMRTLVSKKDSDRPLYLTLACEEIRRFGVFTKLNEKLRDLPQTIGGLISEMLTRIETECGAGLVKSAFSYLLASRGGLMESELEALLVQGDKNSEASWATLRLGMLPWVSRQQDSYGEEDLTNAPKLLDISQSELRQISTQRYLPFASDAIKYHDKLARYHQQSLVKDASSTRALNHLVHHALNAKLWGVVVQSCLCNLTFIVSRCVAGQLVGLMSDYAAAVGVDGGYDGKDWVAAMQTFVLSHAHILKQYPTMAFQLALNSSIGSVPQKISNSTSAASETALNDWIRLVNPTDNITDPCRLSIQASQRPLTCVAFNRYGTLVATTGKDKTVRLFDTRNGKCLVEIREHEDATMHCCFSPEDNEIASCSADNTIRIFAVADGKQRICLKSHRKTVNCIAYLQKKGGAGSGGLGGGAPLMISASDDCSGILWNPQDGSIVKRLKGHTAPVTSCAFHDEGGRYAATGCFHGEVRVWSLEDGSCKAVFAAFTKAVRSVSFAPSMMKIIAATSYDGRAKLLDVDADTDWATMRGHAGPVGDCCFTDDGEDLITVSDDGTVRKWSASTMASQKLSLVGHSQSVASCAVVTARSSSSSSSSRPGAKSMMIATAGADGALKVWGGDGSGSLDRGNGPVAHGNRITALCFSSDNEWLASASRDGYVCLWKMPSGQLWTKINLNADAEEAKKREFIEVALSVCWNPASTQVLVGTTDGMLRFFDTAGQSIGRPNSSLHGSKAIRCIQFSRDEKWLATGGTDRNVVICDPLTMVSMAKLGHADWVTSVSFSSNSRWLISGCLDGCVRVYSVGRWSAPPQIVNAHQNWITSVHFASDVAGSASQFVASCYDGTSSVWSLDNKSLRWKCSSRLEQDSPCCTSAAAFIEIPAAASHPTIATASHDHVVRLHNRKGKPLSLAFVCDSPVTAMTSSQEGGVVVVGDVLGFVHILRLEAKGQLTRSGSGESSASSSAAAHPLLSSAAAIAPTTKAKLCKRRVGPNATEDEDNDGPKGRKGVVSSEKKKNQEEEDQDENNKTLNLLYVMHLQGMGFF